MDISPKIDAVYQRALLLKQRASESPIHELLLQQALEELYFVLEELQVSEEELFKQNQELISTRQTIELERQHYHDLFDQAPDSYLVTDDKGIILEANSAIASMLKVSQQFLIGKPFAFFIADDTRRAFYVKLPQLQRLEKLQDWELRLCPHNSHPFDVTVTLTTIPNSQKQPRRLRWLIRDITERKQVRQLLESLNTELERQVQERTLQLQQALDFAASLKRITDKVRDSLDENYILQAAVKELTLTLGSLCCNTCSYDLDLGTATIRYQYKTSIDPTLNPFLFLPDQIVSMMTFAEGYHQLLQNQDFQFCQIDAVPHPAILACPIADDQGVLGDLWLFKQPTEAFTELEVGLVHQVANQCAIAIRQARLYQTSQQQVEELERLNHLKDDFLSTVSHELRTPLTSIRMAIQMLEITLKQAEAGIGKANTANHYLQILRDECQREMGLINDLLDLARLDANIDPLMLTTADLSEWMPSVIAPFRDQFCQQQQRLQLDISPQLPPLRTDFSYLERILSELLTNAYKYTPPEGTITISAQATAASLQLQVSNSGIEVPAKELSYIFDKFYRVPRNDPWKHGGTGLGLALVKKRVEQIQGTIEVAKEENWLTLTLHIPWDIT
ncbi:MAG TPA: ATP-binding protein [Candidatus Obscuribacterales bacterium]